MRAGDAAESHIVMVNVEGRRADRPADRRTERARPRGRIPLIRGSTALTAEMVDWARAIGFPRRRRGQGHKYLRLFMT